MAYVVPEFIGRKQNKITIAGVKYRAKEQSGCKGCTFDEPFGCDHPQSADGIALCSPVYRKDGRSVIWIKKD